MRSEIEVERELKAVRKWLRKARADGAPQRVIGQYWHAQQAFLWMLGRGASVSQAIEITEKIADRLALEDEAKQP